MLWQLWPTGFTAALIASLFTYSSQAWVHPGILETNSDLARMKSLVRSGKEPWKTAYDGFVADSYSSISYSLAGPFQVVTRDTDSSLIQHVGQFAADSVAALQMALMWTITGNTSYADKSVEILNEWGETLEVVNGTDGQLAAALSGSNLVNAAEIIRATYNSSSYASGWTSKAISTFSKMVTEVLVPPASRTTPTADQKCPFQANWGSSGKKFMVAAVVFTENSTLYEQAKTLILSSACANFTGSIAASGQSSESGRDQQHTMLGLGN